MSTITIEIDDDTLANIRTIAGPDDGEIARFLGDYLATHLGPQEDFTPEQRATIEAGLKAIEEGRTTPHDQVMAEARRRIRRCTSIGQTTPATPSCPS